MSLDMNIKLCFCLFCSLESASKQKLGAIKVDLQLSVTSIKVFTKHGKVHCKRMHVDFSEIAPPMKVSYLDCKMLEPPRYQLSWGLPGLRQDREGCDTYDKRVTHFVVKYKDEEDLKTVTVSASPCDIIGTH